MKGLEGQRLLPEAIAVGLHALDVLEATEKSGATTTTIDTTTITTTTTTTTTTPAPNTNSKPTPTVSNALQSRLTIVSLLEHLHAQIVGKSKTASDALLLSKLSTDTVTDPSLVPSDKERSRLEKSEELSRRILGLGVYAQRDEDGKENNNVGATPEESRVNIVNHDSMEAGARIAHPDAFLPVQLKNIERRLRGYKLATDVSSGVVSVACDVEQGDAVYTDMSPLVIRSHALSFDAVGLDRAACSMFEILFSVDTKNESAETSTTSMKKFATRVRRLFYFFTDKENTAKMQELGNPFDPRNRAVFRNFAQEMACRGMGSDRMACVRHYCSKSKDKNQKEKQNPLSVILRCLHCVRRALQPFQDVDGSFGLALSIACPVGSAENGNEATIGFKIEQGGADASGGDIVRYLALRNLKKGDVLKAVWLGQL